MSAQIIWVDGDVKFLDGDVVWYPPSAFTETIADTISLSDDLGKDAEINLGDTINLLDAIAAEASKQLADGISLADQLAQVAHISADTLGDTIVLTDTLVLGAHIRLEDIISLNDALALGAGINLADGINITDQIIVLTPSILLEDTITLTDNIDNIIPGVSNVAVGETIKNWNQPVQWEKPVTNNPSSLSGITDSSKNTTFGQENPYTVLDASAWDLSKVEVGYIAVTTSGFMGVVISIGSNTVTVQSWHKAGIERVYGATDLPEDGDSVTIHYRLRAKRVFIRSKEGNSNTIYVEHDGRYMDITSGHPIVATQWKRNSEVEISAPRDRWLNLSRIWIISLTNQTALVIVDGRGE